MRVSPLVFSFARFAFLVIYLERDLSVRAAISSLFPACNATRGETVGDGSCDSDNNNEGCEYDGGDCCRCTCVDGDYLCGTNSFECRDPTASDACATASPSPTPLSITSSGLSQSEYPNCSSVVGYIPYIRNGFCDRQNNNEECGYDGGDCCACTCEDDHYPCGINRYDCVDPTVTPECAGATSMYLNCTGAGGSEETTNDGRCDEDNNNEECGYDGGDCCPCTCVDSVASSCGTVGYDCLDPAAVAECLDASTTYSNCTGAGGLYYNINDGLCNDYNNIEECRYDGGDCCNCTCVDREWSCGVGGYDCLDPTVPLECVNASSPYVDCIVAGGIPRNINNGLCDANNNLDECGYDGGDCCPCTCVGDAPPCGIDGYDCRDPTVLSYCVDVSASTDDTGDKYPSCEGVGGDVSAISGGYCTEANNNEECGYDGGDCCPCTCLDHNTCGVNGYDCRDPTVPTNCSEPWLTSTSNHSGMFPECGAAGGSVSMIGNGHCSSVNNIEECEYDGGDCCPCTCLDDSYMCGVNGYDCRDPAAPSECVDMTSTSIYYDPGDTYPDCEAVGGSVWVIGNGYCTDANNNEECGYDGGDCCPCTCVADSSACGATGFDCQDPTVPESCPESPSYDEGTSRAITSSTYGSMSSSHSSTESITRGSIPCMGNTTSVGNGFCDVENNNGYCDYDGGDCCSCTCHNSDDSACGDQWYDCRDPGTNCGGILRTVGVAMLTGLGVFVLMLGCYFVPWSRIAKRARGRRGFPTARPKSHRSRAVHAFSEAEDAKTSDPSMCAAEEGRTEENAWDQKRSAPPSRYGSYASEGRTENAWDPMRPAPRLPGPAHVVDEKWVRKKEIGNSRASVQVSPRSCAVEGVEDGKAGNFSTPPPLLPDDVYAVDKEEATKKGDDAEVAAPLPPPSPDGCAVEEGMIEAKEARFEASVSHLPDGACAVDEEGKGKEYEVLTLPMPPLPDKCAIEEGMVNEKKAGNSDVSARRLPDDTRHVEEGVEEDVRHSWTPAPSLHNDNCAVDEEVVIKRAGGSVASALPVPSLPDGCVGEEAMAEEDKAGDPKPSASALPDDVFAVDEGRTGKKTDDSKVLAFPSPHSSNRCAGEAGILEEKDAGDSKDSTPALPRSPDRYVAEEGKRDDEKGDSRAPACPLPDDIYAIDEGGAGKEANDFEVSAPPSPSSPDACFVEGGVAAGERAERSKSPSPSLANDANAVDQGQAEKKAGESETLPPPLPRSPDDCVVEGMVEDKTGDLEGSALSLPHNDLSVVGGGAENNLREMKASGPPQTRSVDGCAVKQRMAETKTGASNASAVPLSGGVYAIDEGGVRERKTLY